MFCVVLKAFDLQVKQLSTWLPLQVKHEGWQGSPTQFPFWSNWKPEAHWQVPSVRMKALALQLEHPLTDPATQLSHLLLQVRQLPVLESR